jgi:hypothetical protein
METAQTDTTYHAPSKKPRNPAATYDYCDEEGKLLFQVLKFGKGDFTQRRPNPERPGGWEYSLGDTRRVPYRLPELIEAIASGHPVFVVEGEKDVDSLWNFGIPATTNPHGAGKWRNEYSSHFLGAKVYLIPDNDVAGRKHVVQAKQSLGKYAVAVHVVELPGVPDNGGDVSDWIRAGGDAQKLYALAEEAETKEWEFKDTGDSKQEGPEQEPEIDLRTVVTFIGDTPAAPPKELIKGLIPAEGVVVTGGQSGGGKTFIQLHKAICLATVTPYFGHKIVERVGTVLVAAEGRPLLPNRFAAGLSKLSITDRLPISWLRQLPDFSSSEGIKLFIAQLKALDEKYRGDFGVRLGNAVIDTVAACFGMKDEDDNAEATKVCNSMRRVGEEVGCVMSPVHHYGKNPESGLRGASAWKGSADLIEGVLADIDPLSGRVSNRELVCAKARDGEQGPISGFDLEFIELGLDGDGEIYGSCCVVPTERESRFDKGKAPSKGQKTILDAINEALDTCSQTIVPRTGMPQVRAAKVIDVRKEFDRRYVVPDADQTKAVNAKRMAFKRALDCLSAAKFGAGSYNDADWIWKIT